jgi:hypothetical protein
VASLVLNDPTPPAAVWFLGYLSEVVPAELVVTNLHIKREEDLWKVHLAGTYQKAIKPATPEALSNAVGLLTARLSDGPFHVGFPSDADKTKAAEARARTSGGGVIPTWVANVAGGIPAKPPPTEQFTIEGVMR